MQLTLNPGESKQVPLEHRYLMVLEASHAFEVSAPGVNAFPLRSRKNVDLVEPRTITIKNIQTVVLTVEVETAPFKVSEIDIVDIGTLPAMEIAPDQTVAVGTVDFPVGASVEVSALPDVVVSTMPKLKKDASGSYTGLTAITFNLPAKTVAANALRKEIQIKAAIENTGLIWVGATAENVGIPLSAGESGTFEVSTVLNLYCTTTTDKAYVAEVVE